MEWLIVLGYILGAIITLKLMWYYDWQEFRTAGGLDADGWKFALALFGGIFWPIALIGAWIRKPPKEKLR